MTIHFFLFIKTAHKTREVVIDHITIIDKFFLDLYTHIDIQIYILIIIRLS